MYHGTLITSTLPYQRYFNRQNAKINHKVLLFSSSVSLFRRIDDIEDRSILHRGIPVAHSIYGMASTINASNYVYFLGLERTQALEHREVRVPPARPARDDATQNPDKLTIRQTCTCSHCVRLAVSTWVS